jgi:hypothetical protein
MSRKKYTPEQINAKLREARWLCHGGRPRPRFAAAWASPNRPFIVGAVNTVV